MWTAGGAVLFLMNLLNVAGRTGEIAWECFPSLLLFGLPVLQGASDVALPFFGIGMKKIDIK